MRSHHQPERMFTVGILYPFKVSAKKQKNKTKIPRIIFYAILSRKTLSEGNVLKIILCQIYYRIYSVYTLNEMKYKKIMEKLHIRADVSYFHKNNIFNSGKVLSCCFSTFLNYCALQFKMTTWVFL